LNNKIFFTRHTAQEEGDHKFCWDNTFSSYNSKTVFFELLLENENDHEEWNWDEEIGLTSEDIYEMKVQDIQVS
jgi:p24 family protein gamma-2